MGNFFNTNARLVRANGAGPETLNLEVNDPQGDLDPVNKRWTLLQIQNAIVGEDIIDTTVAALQAMANKGKGVWYRVADATFQSSPQILVIRSNDDGNGMELEGYLRINGVIYPCYYDLATDTVNRFYDPVNNNDISRLLNGGNNCVDVFPIANNAFQNVRGDSFNFTWDGIGSLSNCTIYPGAQVTLQNNSTIGGVEVGRNASIIVQDTSVSGGSILIESVIKIGASVFLDNNSYVDATDIDSYASLNVGQTSGASVYDSYLEHDADVTVDRNSTVAEHKFKSDSNVTCDNGSFIGGGFTGVDSNMFVGQTASSQVYDNVIGEFSTATFDNGVLVAGCTLGNYLTLTVTDGSQNQSYRYVEGFSNWKVFVDITGLANLDLTSMPHAGYVALQSSNAAETLDNVFIPPSYFNGSNADHEVWIFVDPNAFGTLASVTFNDDSVNAGNIHLPAAINSTTINKASADFIVLEHTKFPPAVPPVDVYQINSGQF